MIFLEIFVGGGAVVVLSNRTSRRVIRVMIKPDGRHRGVRR